MSEITLTIEKLGIMLDCIRLWIRIFELFDIKQQFVYVLNFWEFHGL